MTAKATTDKKKKTATKKPETKKATSKSASKTAQSGANKNVAKILEVHYHRFNGDYDGWGLHVWPTAGNAIAESMLTSWDNPLQYTSQDDFGGMINLELVEKEGQFGIINHQGHQKDLDLDIVINVAELKKAIYLVQGNPEVFTTKTAAKKAVKAAQA